LPPLGSTTNGQRAVAADGEAARIDGAGLGRAVELELVVRDDGACAAVAVAQNAVVQITDQGGVGGLGVS
jgi:hypothetical protein